MGKSMYDKNKQLIDDAKKLRENDQRSQKQEGEKIDHKQLADLLMSCINQHHTNMMEFVNVKLAQADRRDAEKWESISNQLMAADRSAQFMSLSVNKN